MTTRDDRDWRSALARCDEILFLCSGNILRSAFAELYGRHVGVALPLRSGATVYDNRSLHPGAERALQERGAPRALWRDFRPTPLQRLAPPGPGTLVFGMTAAHLSAFPEHGARFLLSEVLGRREDIADPIDLVDMRPIFDTIQSAVDRLRTELQHRDPQV